MRQTLCLGLLVVAVGASAAAQEKDARWRQAYERLDAFIAREMSAAGTPGMAVALTTRDRLLRAFAYGFADLKARRPVKPETLFEIGSISKSFTAVALMQLREQGKLDPQQPVKNYLPWFEVQTKFAPITVHHLLTHTAGIPRDRDDIPASLFQAVALRERSTGYPPGVKYSYSNIGYQVLSYLLEQFAERSYAEVIRQRIFEPLAMTASVSAITHGMRERLAVGYVRAYDDRPEHESHPLVEGTWMEYGTGDGSIAATPADLAAYLRMLLNRGATPSGRIMSEESFNLMIQRASKQDDSSYYGYGLSTRESEGHTILSHGGGMIGYASAIAGDLDDGVGAVVFVNGPGAPMRVAQYALRLLRAALHGQELPPMPVEQAPTKVANAADFAGTFTSPNGGKLTFVAEDESLLLLHADQKIALERRGSDAFYVSHPDFAMHLFAFAREKGREKADEKGKQGKVVELFHGSEWFANERYAGPREFTLPQQWAAYTGHYRSYSPWLSNFRVVARKDKLWVLFPEGQAEPLVPLATDVFQVGDKETAEEIRLDTLVNGKTLRAQFSGAVFYRTFTP